MVKAQVASGGRGKAGAIQSAASLEDAARIIARLAGTRSNGKPIHGFRIEQRIDFAHEAYVSLSVDAETARIRLMVAAEGGVDVEARAAHAKASWSTRSDCRTRSAKLAPHCRRHCATRCTMQRCGLRTSSCATRRRCSKSIRCSSCRTEAGSPATSSSSSTTMRSSASRRSARCWSSIPTSIPRAARKLAHGFDYVEVDPQGEIGLITTGAGLSMQLIDELKSQGRRPLNFCDIRSGQFRGDPARLIAVMRWIASRPSVRVVLVNIFAGITDLAEFARLLVQAAAQVPELRVPIVARLIGRNLDEARQILDASGLAVTLEPDLDRAVALTLAALDGEGARRG